MFPLVRVRSEQVTTSVWESMYSIKNPFHKLTLTHWRRPTPHSIPTSPGAASSSESVASVTDVGGHSAHVIGSSTTVGDHPIGQ